MYNASSYVVVGKLVMERHHIMFWTRCATHCKNLMFEDMVKNIFFMDVIY